MSKKESVKKDKVNLEYRPPVVALLGHVDHGKTTILDKIRKTSIQNAEVGGITQCISVSSIKYEGKDITFIDTPGHESFDLMRSRGGEVADIILLIVSSKDGVKPQTKESIEIINSTGTYCIVVINKYDIPGIDLEKVKRDISSAGLTVESLGGDIPCVELNAKTGENIEGLLEMINLVAEVNKINVKKETDSKKFVGCAFILESCKDNSIGNVSTVLVISGTLKKGDYIIYSKNNKLIKEKIKGFISPNGLCVSSIDEGYGGQIIGLSNVPELGSRIYSVISDSIDLSELFTKEIPVSELVSKTESDKEVLAEKSTSDLLAEMYQAQNHQNNKKGGEIVVLNVIIRASTQGALDAVQNSLKEQNKGTEIIRIIDASIGSVTLNDVIYAKNMGSIVIGFGVNIDKAAEEYARREKVLTRSYNLIYDLVDEITDAALAMQAPEEKEEITAKCKVKQIFVLSNGSKVIGMRVEEGEVKNGLKCRIIRGQEIIELGTITSMRINKEKVNKASSGMDCGIVVDTKHEALEGDMLHCYRIVKG
ncbi:GTP-binding protein [Candidatus Dojkabacteria bacterium]|nr:GTP-binding protein [Candidatus Dojkabacteria bacterium]